MKVSAMQHRTRRSLRKLMKICIIITGQKAVITYSRKDIANFKLRKGMPIGCKGYSP